MAIVHWKSKQQIEEEQINRPPTEIELLQQENILLKAQNKALRDITDFHEELIVELAMMVYQ